VILGVRPFAEPGIYTPSGGFLDPEGRDCFVFGQDRGVIPGLPHDWGVSMAGQDRGPFLPGREEAQVVVQDREVLLPRKRCKGA
jgi:hypothetical protein